MGLISRVSSRTYRSNIEWLPVNSSLDPQLLGWLLPPGPWLPPQSTGILTPLPNLLVLVPLPSVSPDPVLVSEQYSVPSSSVMRETHLSNNNFSPMLFLDLLSQKLWDFSFDGCFPYPLRFVSAMAL